MGKFNTVEDFWINVEVKEAKDCWPWKKFKKPDGYGLFRFNRGKWMSHRFAFWIINKTLPRFVCHTCDNPSCCNPNHLFAGDAAKNNKDMVAKGRQARGEGHGTSRFTEKIIKEMRNLYEGGASQRALAKKYQTDRIVIQRIVNRKTWKHVT